MGSCAPVVRGTGVESESGAGGGVILGGAGLGWLWQAKRKRARSKAETVMAANRASGEDLSGLGDLTGLEILVRHRIAGNPPARLMP